MAMQFNAWAYLQSHGLQTSQDVQPNARLIDRKRRVFELCFHQPEPLFEPLAQSDFVWSRHQTEAVTLEQGVTFVFDLISGLAVDIHATTAREGDLRVIPARFVQKDF